MYSCNVKKFIKLLQIIGVISFILYFVVGVLYNSFSWFNHLFG